MRARDEQHHKYTRAFFRGSRIFRATEISCQYVLYLVVNNRHIFHWPTERQQLFHRLLGISYPRSCLGAYSLCRVFFVLLSSSHILVL